VTAGGALLIATAKVLLGSSDISANVSGQATRRVAVLSADDDKRVFQECADSHAIWVEARKDANAGIAGAVDDVRKSAQDAEAAKRAAATSAADASTSAANATKAAEESAKARDDAKARIDALDKANKGTK
jgi:hypothetical protein